MANYNIQESLLSMFVVVCSRFISQDNYRLGNQEVGVRVPSVAEIFLFVADFTFGSSQPTVQGDVDRSFR